MSDLVRPINFRYKLEVIFSLTNIKLYLGTYPVIADVNLVCFSWILVWICFHHSFILSFCDIQLESLVDVLNVCDLFKEIIYEVLFFLRGCIEHINLLTRASVKISWNPAAFNLHPWVICTLPSFVASRLHLV